MTTVGRVTGNPHHIEIWYVEHDGCYYLCCEYPDRADWVKNIRKTPQVSFYVAEREQKVPVLQGFAQELTEAGAKLEAVKAKFREKYNWDDGLMMEICPA